MAKREPTEVTLRIRRIAKIERLKDKIAKAEQRVEDLKETMNELVAGQ